MPANNVLRIADIDFDNIKNNLKAFLSNQNELLDYDYDSSTMSIILDLLAYNTYMNSMYLNFTGNEMFLDSAQVRNNIVSRAKMLGYTPRSARGATANLSVTVTPSGSPASVNIAKDTTFTAIVNGVTYKFVTPKSFIISPVNGIYTGTIQITEGEPLTHRFTASTSSPIRYVLPNKNIDSTSIKVSVETSSSNSQSTSYNLVTDTIAVTANSKIYFLQENMEQQIELVFGDGVIGNALSDGNIVDISYRVVNGIIGNGINIFIGPSSIGGHNDFVFTVTSNAIGGTEIETDSSIQFNAPKHFETQNRAVTAEDYKQIILRDNADIQSINVWGGEENDPKIYGKVFITAKPATGAFLSAARKLALKNDLKRFQVMSIDAEFVDATYLYIVPTIESRYNSDLTTLPAASISNKIIIKVTSYETNNLGIFGNKFRYSRFLSDIDSADISIISSLATVQMQKRFLPVTTQMTTYKLMYNNEIYNPHVNHIALSSTGFTYLGVTSFFDSVSDGTDIGTVRIYILIDAEKSYVRTNAGTINFVSGLVTIDSILITAFEGNEIKINVWPKVITGELSGKSDITAIRNQILLISDTKISIINDSTSIIESVDTSITTTGTEITTITDGVNTVVY